MIGHGKMTAWGKYGSGWETKLDAAECFCFTSSWIAAIFLVTMGRKAVVAVIQVSVLKKKPLISGSG